jgi:hypothetical protein
MLHDMAYDGDGVRQQLDQRETKPVIPTTPTESACSPSTSAISSCFGTKINALVTPRLCCCARATAKPPAAGQADRAQAQFLAPVGSAS